jgi:proteasome lid subunit RPN8/RPN11
MDQLEDRTLVELWLTRAQWEQMCAQADRCAPEEACGLLAGNGSRVQAVIPVTNDLHSPVRYSMHPVEQIRAFEEIEKQGWGLIGIYHTHPAGPEIPSPRDVAEAYYPESIYLILSGEAAGWRCRAFHIRNNQISDVLVQVTD